MDPNTTPAARKILTLSNRTEQNVFPARLEPSLQTARTLEGSPDYRPDWRWAVVEAYLNDISSQPGWANNPAKQLEEILEREPDQVVRETLLYHAGKLPESQKGPLEYAVRCLRVTETSMAVKAMIIANLSIEYIAKELGTHQRNINCFELLFFDVRPYLANRVWLRHVCFGQKGHRWLQVAFDRGWPGVKEVVLQTPQKGERDLSSIVSALYGRVQAMIFEKEASNIAPSDKELFMFLATAQSYCRGKFYLSDEQDLPNETTQLSRADPGTRDLTFHEIAEELQKRSRKQLHEFAAQLLQNKIAEERSKRKPSAAASALTNAGSRDSERKLEPPQPCA
jgi:hypothetical protein